MVHDCCSKKVKATDFYYHLGNCHIYDDHLDSLTEQIQKKPLPFPTIKINSVKETMEEYSLADLEILNYNSHGIIKMEMRK